eukprot:TRINITY_DN6880_c0_g1_i1.p1 TRINITY_DN6880_c0_g1~~TRINITY_DN6880_c0_g1_i1.p1  ORF type:complete len:374 (+),score=75.23 TRINITY_DN6880_c0_g1_i1:189-1310(+)
MKLPQKMMWASLRRVSTRFKTLSDEIFKVSWEDLTDSIEKKHSHSVGLFLSLFNLHRQSLGLSSAVLIERCIHHGNVEVLKVLLRDRRVLLSISNESLRILCNPDKIDFLSLLLKEERFISSINLNCLFLSTVNSGNLEGFLGLIGDSRVNPLMKNQRGLRIAAQNGNEEMLRYFLSVPGSNPAVANNEALMRSVFNSYENIVRILLGYPKVDPMYQNGRALKTAATKDSLEIFRLLLEDARFTRKVLHEVLLYCAKKGKNEYVQLLLLDERVDPSEISFELAKETLENCKVGTFLQLYDDLRINPSANSNFAIRSASYYGHHGVVERLLLDERVNPSDHNNAAYHFARKHGHQKVVLLLEKDKRVTQPKPLL